MKMTREQFINAMVALMGETYQGITKDMIKKEVDQQIDQKIESRTIIGLFVSGNLKKNKVD